MVLFRVWICPSFSVDGEWFWLSLFLDCKRCVTCGEKFGLYFFPCPCGVCFCWLSWRCWWSMRLHDLGMGNHQYWSFMALFPLLCESLPICFPVVCASLFNGSLCQVEYYWCSIHVVCFKWAMCVVLVNRCLARLAAGGDRLGVWLGDCIGWGYLEVAVDLWLDYVWCEYWAKEDGGHWVCCRVFDGEYIWRCMWKVEVFVFNAL